MSDDGIRISLHSIARREIPENIDLWPRLVYSAADGLHGFDLSTGRITSFGTDGNRPVWSPDDALILFSTTFDLYIINADGSGLCKIDTGSAEILSSVGWLPDNQSIVYGAMGGSGFTFTTYNLQNGK